MRRACQTGRPVLGLSETANDETANDETANGRDGEIEDRG